jgi:hypothetical protein
MPTTTPTLARRAETTPTAARQRATIEPTPQKTAALTSDRRTDATAIQKNHPGGSE